MTQLFISFGSGELVKVCKNTISSWVRETIKEAHKNCSEESLSSLKVNAHEVRAIGTSIAFFGNTAMEEVMRAARWTNQSTFTTFYMRDVAEDLEGVRSLGPVMVAQQIL